MNGKKQIPQIIGMGRIRSKAALFLALAIVFSIGCIAQTSSKQRGGIDCCVKAQLDKLDIIPYRVNGSREYVQKGQHLKINGETLILNGKDLTSTTDSKAWVREMSVDSLQVYYLDTGSHLYFVLRSQPRAVTGLAANLYNWLLVDVKTRSVITANLVSLSNDIRMFYVRKGIFYIKIYDFSDEFFSGEREFVNTPIKLTVCRVLDNGLKILSQKDTTCICR